MGMARMVSIQTYTVGGGKNERSGLFGVLGGEIVSRF